jgi:hypothetical protein
LRTPSSGISVAGMSRWLVMPVTTRGCWPERNHRWRARLEAVELGAMAPASAFHEFLAVVAEHDDDGVVEQLLLAQMVDHAADLRIDVVRGVDVAVLDLADLRLEIGGDVVEIFEIGLGDRRLGREVVVGVRRLEEHVGHERALCIAPVDEVEHFADVDLIALPRIGAALALMHVRWIHLRETVLSKAGKVKRWLV